MNITNRIDINFMHRKTADADIYFLYNPDSVARQLACKFRIKNEIPELWNPLTGEVRKSGQFKCENNTTKVWINLEAEESVFVVFRESAQEVFAISEPQRLAEGEYFLTKDNILQVEKISESLSLTIEGNWEVEFLKEYGYVGKHTFETLTDWKDNTDENIKYYSGSASYKTTFEWNEDLKNSENQYILDLGVAKIVAEVILNGKNMGVSWMPPFKVDITEAMQKGENQLEIRITNQWSNKLIGDERFPTSYAGYKLEGNFPKGKMMDWFVNNESLPTGKRTTFCTADFYKADDPLLPSGLLGPVRILKNERTNKIE